MKNAMIVGALLAPLALVACSGNQQADAEKVNQIRQRIADQGQLYCQIATQTGPLVVALANTSGVPVNVTGKASAVVMEACAVVAAVPVPPPPSPGTVPVMAAAVPAAATAP